MLHKYIHGWLPTGNHLKRRYKIENQCPFCSKPEDEEHLGIMEGMETVEKVQNI